MEFFHALDSSGCATPGTGWAPHFVLIESDGELVAGMPLYAKSHSYGEYVFDWAWADAYERHGFSYYPKLLSAVPFTPVPGNRLLSPDPEHRARLVEAALGLAQKLGVSSLHGLFLPREETDDALRHGLMLRRGVQFHWLNEHYPSFETFLSRLSHDKRKKIRQERRKVRDAGISFRWHTGTAISRELWSFFHRCYCNTYRLHRSTPYLNLEFFHRIGDTMPDNTVMFVALRDGNPVAASLAMRGGERLYGRYWGSTTYIPGLHFEACYYQAIEFAIANGIRWFEGGAQGEHKMARGLMPVETYSVHWLSHPAFATAVEDFLARESHGMNRYFDELADRSPFRSEESG